AAATAATYAAWNAGGRCWITPPALRRCQTDATPPGAAATTGVRLFEWAPTHAWARRCGRALAACLVVNQHLLRRDAQDRPLVLVEPADDRRRIGPVGPAHDRQHVGA